MNSSNKSETHCLTTSCAYKRSIVAVVALVLVGLLLQMTIGGFNINLIQFPVNLIILAAMVIFLIIMAFYNKTQLFQWLSGVPLSVSNIGALLLFGLVMGLVPQASPEQTGISVFGFDAVTRSWSFAFIYLFTIVNLSCVATRRLLNFSWKDYAFYLNHLGLLFLLVAAGFGAADQLHFYMNVEEGQTEWRAVSKRNDVAELPIAIHLNDFYMEEYAPKLAIVNLQTGNAIPAQKPQMWAIDTLKTSGKIAGWNISLKKYIAEAIRANGSVYQPVAMPGACPTAMVNVDNQQYSIHKSGWVSCGNYAQPYMSIELNDTLALIMMNPEPKLFRSDVTVYTKNEKKISYQLEVNKPLSVNGWMIYQNSYDVERGKDSSISSFELVYDPWLKWVYLGIALFFAGSVCLLWQGNKKLKENKL